MEGDGRDERGSGEPRVDAGGTEGVRKEFTSVKVPKDVMAAVDRWREKTTFVCGRADAVRVLLKFALDAETRTARRRKKQLELHQGKTDAGLRD
jgi:hypothetical protein